MNNYENGKNKETGDLIMTIRDQQSNIIRRGAKLKIPEEQSIMTTNTKDKQT